MATMNPDAGVVTRQEYDWLASRIKAIEKSREAAPRIDEASLAPDSEVVRQNEFRLFKWIGTFVVGAVLTGFVFLYQQTADLRVGIERLHVEIERVRGDMQVEMERLRSEMLKEMERLRSEMLKEMERQHAEIREEIADVREDVANLSERVARVETFLEKREES